MNLPLRNLEFPPSISDKYITHVRFRLSINLLPCVIFISEYELLVRIYLQDVVLINFTMTLFIRHSNTKLKKQVYLRILSHRTLKWLPFQSYIAVACSSIALS